VLRDVVIFQSAVFALWSQRTAGDERNLVSSGILCLSFALA